MVVVSCGTQESGIEWLQNHGFSFPLIDRDRVFYRQVGLRRFLKNTFCVKNFKRYGDEQDAEPPYSGSDFSVNGGDFVVDSSGKLLMLTTARTSLTDLTLRHWWNFCKEQID